MVVTRQPNHRPERPAIMDRNARSARQQQQSKIKSRARACGTATKAVEYFNVLTSPEMLATTERLMPINEFARLLDTEVVLDIADADHDVADIERGIEPTGHAAQHQRPAAEAVEQQGRRHAGIDLPGTRFDEDGVATRDLATPEGMPADGSGLSRPV